MDKMIWFILGWFLSLFATHNFGWEPVLKVGFMLFITWIFFMIILDTEILNTKFTSRSNNDGD